MLVQIYEVADPVEAVELVRLEVDHIGVLVGRGDFPRERSYAQARVIFDMLSDTVSSVALSLSADPDEVARVVRETKPDIIHIGAAIELFSVDQTLALKQQFPAVQIMRAIPVVGEVACVWARDYDSVADWLLLDSHKAGDRQIGAQGVTHDWSVSRRIVDQATMPVILAGGLGPDNVAEAIEAVRPAGVDSKTMTDRDDDAGKDLREVANFVRNAKADG